MTTTPHGYRYEPVLTVPAAGPHPPHLIARSRELLRATLGMMAELGLGADAGRRAFDKYPVHAERATRAATLLNLAGTCDLKATDLELVIVLHGDATSAALDDDAYKALTGAPHPHADLMKKLRAAGVRFLVCGQSLARKGYDPKRVRDGVTVAASAVSATINLQARGFAYVPAH